MLLKDQKVKSVHLNQKIAFKRADIQPHDLFSNCFVIIYSSCISGLFISDTSYAVQSDQQKPYCSIIMCHLYTVHI